MDQQVEPLLKWLRDCRDHTVRIEKTESDDLDVAELRIDDVSLTERTGEHFDDYIAATEIILKGEGTILNAGNNPPLPGNHYEIPLFGSWEGQVREQSLSLRTERAQYVVTKSGISGGIPAGS